MPIIDALIMELTHEGGQTRKLFERIPEDRMGWRPHEKSMSLGALASHIADSLCWTGATLAMDELVMDPGSYQPFQAKDKADLLKKFDDSLTLALSAMRGQSDENLFKTWRMKVGDKVVLEMPRAAVLRTFILSHQIHHRGQMTVYLRLLGAPLPQLYGPTADEPEMVMKPA